MSASALDLSVEISKLAKEVHIASRSKDIKLGKMDGYTNMWRHSMVVYAHPDGSVDFQDGDSLHADMIFYCTGYKYHFPFLETKTVTIDDNCVGPLYQHVFPPTLAPSLSFVGLPYKTIVFTMIEFQSKWVARVLSNKIVLPSAQDMLASVEKLYRQMDDIGMPKHHTHCIYPYQVEYLKWLASELTIKEVEDWKYKMYDAAIKDLISHPDDYRDKWDAEPYISF